MSVTDLRTAVTRAADWSAEHPWSALSLWLGGVAVSLTAGALSLDTPVDALLGDASAQDATWYVLLGSGTVLLLLIALFAAVVPALVSLWVTLSIMALATGWWAVVARLLPDRRPAACVLALVTILGAALGTTSCVLHLRSARPARRSGADRSQGSGTAGGSGHRVLLSSCVTVAVVCGLYVPGDALLSTVATGVLLTVAAVLLASVTVLPAVTARFGRHLGRPRLPVLWRFSYRLGPPRLWPLLLRPGVRHPRWTLAGSMVLHTAMALPLLWCPSQLLAPPTALPPDAVAFDGCGVTAPSVVAMAASAVLLAFAALTAVFRSAPAAVVVTVPGALAAVSACGLSAPLLRLWKPEPTPGSWGLNTPATWAPLIGFVLALALSVLLLRAAVLRVVAHRAAGMAPREAAARAVTRTSDDMTATAVILCTVFLLGERLGPAQVGRVCVVLMVCVVLTVTLVRALTLPSLATLVAGSRWWSRSATRQQGYCSVRSRPNTPDSWARAAQDGHSTRPGPAPHRAGTWRRQT
ncbi:MMPL family transporter [Streptomyces sp. NPDC020742]|uniref:MMPL family transporter n=1 Tax=Streptomyces sp. NPDC020742 TaxID=3154897 RepID=UPI0033D8970F